MNSTTDVIEGRSQESPTDRHELRTCPECSSGLEADGVETFCPDCGLIVTEDWIDPGPEWGPYGSVESIRTGPPLRVDRHDRGLSTDIGFDHQASGRRRLQMRRLRREHKRAQAGGKADRNLALALSDIARMTSALELPRSVRDRASVIFRQAQALGLPLGRSIEAIAAGSVYAACRCQRQLRTVEEVGEVARCSTSDDEGAYSVLNRELGLAVLPVTPSVFVPKLTAAVDSPSSVQGRAMDLVSAVESAGLHNGRHPAGLAAAAVYLAGQEGGQLYTQAELGEVVNVTPNTLRQRLDELRSLEA